MKRIICIILAAVLALSLLSACGGKDAPAETGNQNNNAASNTAEPQPDPTPVCKEEDFATESLGDGNCKLTAYHGDSPVVVIPDTIRGEKVTVVAGVGTRGIKKVVLPDSVEVIDYQAFNYCPDMEEIVFGKGLKEVGYFAFNACDSLTEIIFPEGMIKLSEMPFGICANLKKVYIPASVTELGGRLFYAENMPNLVVVTPAGSAAEKQATADGLTVKNQ